MFKRIMVALDEGVVSNRALDAAIEIAKAMSGQIYIVSAYMKVDNPNRPELLAKIQSQAAEKVSSEGIVVHKQLAAGGKVLGETIIQLANDLNVDMVIMGTNNRGFVGRLMFGSVSDYVVHNLRRPVLIIK